MKLQNVVAFAPPAASYRHDAPLDGLLDGLGDLSEARVLVLGPDIGIMHALMRRGCRDVTELEQNERPGARTADVIILPSVCNADSAACAIANARRGLVPSGRILLQTRADPCGQLGRAIERTLKLQGFSLIRTRRVEDFAVFSAELPPYGPVSRAQEAAA